MVKLIDYEYYKDLLHVIIDSRLIFVNPARLIIAKPQTRFVTRLYIYVSRK